ncbi:MAG: OmpP1/FadL family transporter [Cloacibacterium sp.]
MFKKSLTILSIASAFYLQAQDVSIIRNSVDVYSANPLTGSAKFNAMAGSMGALGGDLSAINTNPASVGVFITGNISGTLAINNSKTTSSFSNVANSYKLNNADLGQLGGVAVFETSRNTPWKFVNFGVNYTNQNLEEYIETPANSSYKFQDSNLVDANGNPVTGTFTSLGHAYDRTGNLTNMNIAFGGNYDNKFYVGGSLNFKGATIEQYDSSRLSLDVDNNNSYVLNKQGTPYTEDANGFSVSAGIIGKINNNIRLGASIESPTWWTQYRTYSEVNEGNLGYYFDYYDEDRKFTSPMKATLSGAFVMNKNFAFNVDYSLGLTKPKYKVQGPAETQLNDFFQSEYKNLSELRVGGEYRYNNFRLRGGYGISNSPFEKRANFDDLYVGKRETLGVGFGFDFKSFYVDAAYNKITTNSTNVYGDGYYYSLANNRDVEFFTNNPNTFTSKLEDVKNNVTLTLGWKF